MHGVLVRCVDRAVLVLFLVLWGHRTSDALDSTSTKSVSSARSAFGTRRNADSAFGRLVAAFRTDSMPMTATLYGIPQPDPPEFFLEEPIKSMLRDTSTKVDKSRP